MIDDFEKELDLGLTRTLLRFPHVYSAPTPTPSTSMGDATGGLTYVFTKELGLAVNTAMATRRPLLLRGTPGSGKSSLARAVAAVSQRAFLSKVITSDTKVDDLLWSYDYVRRLQDASDPNRKLLDDYEYVEPQALWWALAPKAALGRGNVDRKPSRKVKPLAGQPSVVGNPAVLLLDEIDKADPALPNDLLVALGEGRFRIRETAEDVEAEGEPPLIVITTNDERELSRAFTRRCIVTELPTLRGEALQAWLVKVGRAHFPAQGGSEGLVEQLATSLVDRMKRESGDPPSAAEFVDLVRTCVELEVTTGSETFDVLRRLVASKTPSARGVVA